MPRELTEAEAFEIIGRIKSIEDRSALLLHVNDLRAANRRLTIAAAQQKDKLYRIGCEIREMTK